MYPFAAIVNQEAMKTALLVNLIDPTLGGVLLSGAKGTGKTTAVRALAALTPEIQVSAACMLRCDPSHPEAQCEACQASESLEVSTEPMPVVELPLGATEDRVIGTLDVEATLREKRKMFQPGVLADANRGILYIDEVNLLPDHLVDVILDAAAFGLNRIEREGISLVHPARFVLVGSMNPEEGELRPQLLDRFGLFVEVRAVSHVPLRVEVVRRREAYEYHREQFLTCWGPDQEALRRQISAAQALLADVCMPDALCERLARLAVSLRVDTHRAEIATIKAARARAALEGRSEATEEDVLSVVPLAFAHRVPREQRGSYEEAVRQVFAGEETRGPERPSRGKGFLPPRFWKWMGGAAADHSVDIQSTADREPGADGEAPGYQGFKLSTPDVVHLDFGRPAAGGKSGRKRRYGASDRGMKTRVRFWRVGPVDLFHSWKAAVAGLRGEVRRCDLRAVEHAEPKGRFTVLVVDVSDSMDRILPQVEEGLLRLLHSAYLHRDEICLITFREREASVVLKPTRTALLEKEKLRQVHVGGATPLALGLKKGLEVIERHTTSAVACDLVLISDGKANVGFSDDPFKDALSVAERIARVAARRVFINPSPLGKEPALALARALRAEYIELKDERQAADALGWTLGGRGVGRG